MLRNRSGFVFLVGVVRAAAFHPLISRKRRHQTFPARTNAGKGGHREFSPVGSVRVRFANRPGQRRKSQPKGGESGCWA